MHEHSESQEPQQKIPAAAPSGLRAEWERLRAQKPPLRARDIATALGVSEAQLLVGVGEPEVLRLSEDFHAQLGELHTLGPVMALTRNDAAVLENDGAYGRFDCNDHAGLFVEGNLDLRVFPGRFRCGFAMREQGRHGVQHSLQYFDPHGTAVHKIYLREHSDLAAYERFVARHLHAAPATPLPFLPEPEPEPAQPSEAVDAEQFRQDVAAMRDPHEFFGILRKHRLPRLYALELMSPQHARRVDRLALREVLPKTTELQLPIMLFVGNRGMIQIHSGVVNNLKQVGSWYNVLDPGCNLHLQEDLLECAWVVQKPTAHGLVSSLELYDSRRQLVLTVFSKRKADQPERREWPELLASVPSLA